jgi:YesN/AraC family two-component response regulator
MLPCVKLAPDSHNLPERAHENQPGRRPSPILAGKRAVVVEDEGITQMQLRRMLRHAGLVVVGSATTGDEAVDIVLKQRPDIVLMDIRMPGPIDGLEAARRILSEYSVCIIMLTAFSEDEYLQRAQKIHVCGYVLKPVTTDVLIPRIEEAMGDFGNSNG